LNDGRRRWHYSTILNDANKDFKKMHLPMAELTPEFFRKRIKELEECFFQHKQKIVAETLDVNKSIYIKIWGEYVA